MISRMFDQTLQPVKAMVDNEQINALEKFRLLYSSIGDWKLKNKDFFGDILEVVYTDENVLLRYKMKAMVVKQMMPLISKIIHQGAQEGVFNTDYPDDDIAEIILLMGTGLSEVIAPILLNKDEDSEKIKNIQRKAGAHERAVECILNAPKGSLKIFDVSKAKLWFK